MSDNFLISGVAAKGVDALLLRGAAASLPQQVACAALARLVSSVVFPILAALDVGIQGGRALLERVWSLLTGDVGALLAQSKKSWDAAERCLLGLIFSPSGLLSPDIVTHHFIPKSVPAGRLEPYGKLYSAQVQEKFPSTVDEVKNIILEAKQTGKKVAIVGASMSQGKQALPPEGQIVINMKKFNAIEIDPATKIAKVGAGVIWQELQREANKEGLAVQVMQASNIFSIGGSLSANCHGWDHTAGALANTVRALTIVNAEGEKIRLLPQDRLFKCVVGGYGGFGVIVEVELSLIENYLLEKRGVEMAPQHYVKYFKEQVRANKNTALHLYRLSLDPDHLFESGVAVSYVRKGTEKVTTPLVDEPEDGRRSERIALHLVRRSKWARKFAWQLLKRDMLTPSCSSRNEVMRVPIRSALNNSRVDAEWLQEYFVKGKDLEKFLKFLGTLLKENGVPLFNASVRYVKQDEHAELGYAKEGDRFAVVLFFNQSLHPDKIEQTKKWVGKVIDYLVLHEGTYYLPYQQFATQAQFRSAYPQWEKVAGKKREFDPAGLFRNGLYEEYL